MVDGRTLADALALLSGGTARRDLDGFRADHPDVRIRLVSQREEYDGSLQHALLIKDRDGATVSLSWCPDLALPWPLRGVHRAGEHLLLRVNGVETPVARAVACLDFIWDESRLADRLVTDSLVREAMQETSEPLTDAELQEAMNAFRRARGLLTGAETLAWMDRNRISHHELEELVAAEASVARLRSRIAAEGVEDWFAEHGRSLDVARVARVVLTPGTVLPDPGPGGFLESVERAFADGTAVPGEVFATLRREELDRETADAVFAVEPGTVVGPFPTEQGDLMVKVLSVESAILDDTTRDLAERRIFADWVERRRSTAKIEWFWGTAEQTGG
ncbi:TIGR04500 family putative peptide maturation system protein [Streptosporangium sp. NPDC051023]|uniref:TIGR04500 family putative peptide maturation system protein n=1 Tax=Streptosporangium sp. NPDC051023 TaxID=3155410 RepID=UPI00344B57BB